MQVHSAHDKPGLLKWIRLGYLWRSQSLTLFEGKIMVRKGERRGEAGVWGLGWPEVGGGLKQAQAELWIWYILSSPKWSGHRAAVSSHASQTWGKEPSRSVMPGFYRSSLADWCEILPLQGLQWFVLQRAFRVCKTPVWGLLCVYTYICIYIYITTSRHKITGRRSVAKMG